MRTRSINGIDRLKVSAARRSALRGIASAASKAKRTRGTALLFAGRDVAARKAAAAALAAELGRDLMRVDLSKIVSKYIGETEKNLRRVFADAQRSNAVLFFDEADALFGKRTEVKDSHDRYSNAEVAYLLQRIDRSRGLAILATNSKSDIDPTFLRRLRYVLHFRRPPKKR
jgi:SpoVK/Ycf46/Vps4 family AAA+-type ATPase